MKFVADLHLHSKYSRAVSQDMVLPKMAEWAKYKGINVLATGDFTHPFWFDQLKNELEEAGNGLYQLRDLSLAVSHSNGESQKANGEIYFLLSCEISSIYSQGGKTRRIHNLFFFPSLKSVEKFNESLRKKGANLRSDGRPIVGITSRDLAALALSVDERALVIPAHAWTPWFSVFGSFSGFDSIEECFGDMAPYIYGIETGLSSDPAMNWQVGDLDSRAILSFSDAHSLEKMGREATVFEADEVSYEAIYGAIVGPGKPDARGPVSSFLPVGARSDQNSNHDVKDQPELRAAGNPPRTATPRIAFTIEFYPEEGKYHFTGHRGCGVSRSPEDTEKMGETCPVCGRPLTIGVLHRVKELETRNTKPASPARSDSESRRAKRGEHETREINGVRWVYPDGTSRPPYVSLVPLYEIIAQGFGVAPKTKRVSDQYSLLINAFGSEFKVLLNVDENEIAKYANAKVVDGIKRVRAGDIKIEPGYDGKFGMVMIWGEENSGEQEDKQPESQLNLFA